jgi:hypothetical protein
VIGSMDDLDAATLEDVEGFFRTYYVPNNAVLTVAGDFDPDGILGAVRRWFGEIPAGAPIPALPGPFTPRRGRGGGANAAKLPARARDGCPFFGSLRRLTLGSEEHRVEEGRRETLAGADLAVSRERASRGTRTCEHSPFLGPWRVRVS